MKNLGIKLSILTSVFLLTSCASTWSRLPEAKTVALISFDTEKDIVKYQIDGKKTVRMQNQDDIQIGLSEFAALGKGLKGGLKSGLSSVKEVAGGRVGAEVENANLLSKYFMSDMVNRITGSIKASGFQTREWSDHDEWISLPKLKKKTKKITKKANSDVVVTFGGNVGVIKVPDKVKGLGGLVKIDLGSATGGATYELIARYTMYFADAKGYIGSRNFSVNSGIKKRSDKGVPAFSDSDFEKVADELTNKVKSFLKETKLTG